MLKFCSHANSRVNVHVQTLCLVYLKTHIVSCENAHVYRICLVAHVCVLDKQSIDNKSQQRCTSLHGIRT